MGSVVILYDEEKDNNYLMKKTSENNISGSIK